MNELGKSDGIAILERLIENTECLRETPRGSADFRQWFEEVENAIVHLFDEERLLDKWHNISYRYTGPMILGRGRSYEPERNRAYQSGLTQAEGLLKSMIKKINDYWPDEGDEEPDPKVGFKT